MTSVRVYQLAYELAFIRALLDDLAVVLEQMVQEELVELLAGTDRAVFVDLLRQGLAKDQGVGKTTRYRG